jgi:hypothetical protein
MPDRFSDVVKEHNFVVFLVRGTEYSSNMTEIASAAQKHHKKICYVCLSTTYDNVLLWMREGGLDTGKFYFIDTLSSHYTAKEPCKECVFLSSPSSLDEIKDALSAAVKEKGCETVIFDAISSLLEYKDLFSILKFTHRLMTENSYSTAKKLYVVLKDDVLPEAESKRLVTDLEMFADKIVEA